MFSALHTTGKALTGRRTGYHLLAIAIVTVWGTTFVSTKLLLNAGLSPTEIMFYRFMLAYAGICLCSRPLFWRARSARDEVLCLLAGITGGSLYFITENTALAYTQVTNVALICSTTPLLTLLADRLLTRGRQPARCLYTGSAIAFAGVATVVFNGCFVFHLHPAGDLLCLASAASWTLYTLITKGLSNRYSGLFIVRKTFFYGIVTLLPLLAARSAFASPAVLLTPQVALQLLFLGLVASFLCFFLWNRCLRALDTVVTTNYIYLVPVISILASTHWLGESVNAVTLCGAAAAIAGMYVAGRP